MSAEEILEFLRDNSVYHVEAHEAQHLINFFDCNGNQKLDGSELSQIFLPCEDNELRDDANKRSIGKIGP